MADGPPKVVYLFQREDSPQEHKHAPAREVDAVENATLPTPTETFDAAQVEKLLAIPRDQLRRWARSGTLAPSAGEPRQRRYSFRDLVGLRAAKALLESGLESRKLNRAVHALRRQLPHRASPLCELRLARDGGSVVVREDDNRYDAITGQLLLNFDITELRQQIVELITPRGRGDHVENGRAFDAYLEGCRHEAEPTGRDDAEVAYRQAIELDPGLACAYTNLGNLRYRAGATEDARALYIKAIELEPDQPEGQYNLAFLTYEEGALERAVELFQCAIELDPGFADAHFNLGMALIEMGRDDDATSHFTRYLALEPKGPWADLAHEELELHS